MSKQFGWLIALVVTCLMPLSTAVSQQLSPVWVVSTVTGNGTSADTGDGGLAVNAGIARPNQVVVDQAGNLYFSEPANEVVRKINASGMINTIAGTAGMTGATGDGGPAVSALLNSPYGLAIDNNGNLLIADEGNHKIREINAVTGIISTVAGNGTTGYTGDGGAATQASLNVPYTVVCDKAGNLFIADYGSNVIRKVSASGIISTIAGSGTSGYTGDGGPALQATMKEPFGLWLDVAGDLYFTDYGNNAVRMIDTKGNIHTVAGTGKGGSSGDGGPATSALLNGPRTPVGDGLGDLYIADENNETVRAINASGTISTIDGTAGKKGFAGDGGPAYLGESDEPYGITIDSSNNLSFTDDGVFRIRRLSLNTGFPATAVGASTLQNIFLQSTAAVTPKTASVSPASPAAFALGALSGCTLGASLAAKTPCTVPVTFNPAAPGLQTAQLAFTDAGGNVSAIGLSGVGTAPEATFSLAAINTIAGSGIAGNAGASGSASSAELNAPRGGVVDSAGNVYFADSGNHVIRRIDAGTGAISTVAGTGAAGYTGDGGAATSAQLNAPAKVVLDAANDLFIADTGNSVIRFVSAGTGLISTIAGTGTAGYSGDGGPATAAELSHPQGLAVDLGGHVYVADTGNHVIRYFGNGSLITTLTGTGTAGYSGDGGNDYGAQLNAPEAVVLDQSGHVFIADTGNDVVRVISPTNQISTLAGQHGQAANTGDGGAATSATLDQPSDLALDAAGDVYIAAGGQVRMVDTAGRMSTVAGTGAPGSYSGEGGPATAAVLPAPASNLMLDSAGDVLIAATAANRLLKVTSASPIALNFGIQTAGTVSAAQEFSVLNAGNAPLNLSGLAVTAGYTLENGGASSCTPSSSLNPGQSCTISLVFSPASGVTGSVPGSLTVTDNALNGTGAHQVVALLGSTKVVYNTATTLSVSPSPLVYGGSATLTATVANGTSPSGTVTFTVNGVAAGSAPVNNQVAAITVTGLPAGTVTIGAAYSGDANNNSSSAVSSFVVQRAVLTVTANNVTVAFGTAPVFTYTLSGFVNGDTSSVVSGTPSETTTATLTSPQGTYPIFISLGTLTAQNYTFTFVNGILTVGPPPPPDFTFAVTPTSTSIVAGQVGVVTLALIPINGYKGTVTLSCANPPAHISCSFTGPLSGDGKGDPAWTQATIYTDGRTVAAAQNDSPGNMPSVWFALGLPLCFVGFAVGGQRRGWAGRMLGLLALAALAAGTSSCSQGGHSNAPPGTYSLVLTAADASIGATHTTTLSLTIQ